MKVIQIKFNSWDKAYDFDPADLRLEFGDSVIVKTELGLELGKVVGFKDVEKTEAEIKPILRKADNDDLDNVISESEKDRSLDQCKRLVDRIGLPMKLVDAHFSFDGSRITFAFISDGRVDFRELVKELTRTFNKNIRLHQIGIRDEAKICGDCGHCGRPLCCGQFLKELSSVTSDMAELQQVAHRGSERISGVCGRLMCCLGYEHNGYESVAKQMPPIDSIVDVEGKKGRVISWQVLKRSYKVRMENGDDGGIVEVSLKDNTKKVS